MGGGLVCLVLSALPVRFSGGPRRRDKENHHPQGDMDLRRGQSGARRIVHGFDHVFDQSTDLRRGWVGDQLRGLTQDWVPHSGDL